MQVVYEAGNLIDAHLVRHALEHAGIPAWVRGEALLGAVGDLPACGLLAVCVPDSALPQAREVVAELALGAGHAQPAPAPGGGFLPDGMQPA